MRLRIQYQKCTQKAKKTKIINEYADLLTRIRKEYEELYKEHQKLKMTNQQLEKQQPINFKKTNNKQFKKLPEKVKEGIRNIIMSLAVKAKIKKYTFQKKKKKKQKKFIMTMLIGVLMMTIRITNYLHQQKMIMKMIIRMMMMMMMMVVILI